MTGWFQVLLVNVHHDGCTSPCFNIRSLICMHTFRLLVHPVTLQKKYEAQNCIQSNASSAMIQMHMRDHHI